ncbi:MAG: M36 family metallopeptidase, partial [Nocardioides sp.]
MPRFHRRRPAVAVAVLALAITGGLSPVMTPSSASPVASATPVATAVAAAVGTNVLVDLDPATGTPRTVARLDGFLTGPSTKPPRDVVLDYVGANLAAFGLETADLATLTARPTYVDVAGIRHLAWTQSFDGLEVFGHGLRAAVTSSGRLLTITGSPMPGRLVTRAAGGMLTSPDEAIRAARRDLGEKVKAPGPRDVATERLFITDGTTHRAWQTITMSAQSPALTILDATTGEVLHRRDLGVDESAPDSRAAGSRGVAYRYFPGSPQGGKQLAVNFTSRGWLDATATTLDGNNTHVFSDVDDDDLVAPTEEVGPVTGQAWTHQLRPFQLGWASFCGNPSPCSWNPNKPWSWKKNRKQNATQAFFHVNTFHDHLLAGPIGFTEAAGNFQAVNTTGQGLDGDAVQTHTNDGADSGNGLPDGNHVDRSDMATPPDGQAPTMQLSLQHQPGTSYPAGDPYSPTNIGDQADTVFHEYTHGLSNRLVVDAHGNS